ncbi:MAG: DUF805 domain-containing protein [Nitrospirota bacterium]|nr:DUF805 domain-containing protein [Nitrospirota bacterium]
MSELQDISFQTWFVNTPEQRTANRKALFSFQGRVGRSMYWRFAFLPMMTFFILANVFDLHLRMGLFGFTVTGGLLLWINLAVSIKRCHDRGRTGWFVVLSLIPFLGLWVLAELGFLPGVNNSTGFDQTRNESVLSPTVQ